MGQNMSINAGGQVMTNKVAGCNTCIYLPHLSNILVKNLGSEMLYKALS